MPFDRVTSLCTDGIVDPASWHRQTFIVPLVFRMNAMVYPTSWHIGRVPLIFPASPHRSSRAADNRTI